MVTATTLSTGCGDILLHDLFFDTTKDDFKYSTAESLNKFLSGYVSSCPSTNFGRAFTMAILNPRLEKDFGHLFEKHGLRIIAEGVNFNHRHVLTLRGIVNNESDVAKSIMAAWDASKPTWRKY